jgi:putative ABC transport system permease protein
MGLGAFLADYRNALKQAVRNAGFSLTCVALLAFGLAANTAVFAVVYAVMLKPLPYADPDRLVVLHNRFPGMHLDRLGASTLDYLELREHHELFADAGVYYFLDLTRTGTEHPVKVNAIAATASLFHTLGVAPMMGRLFTAQEETYRGPHAVILSEAYWRREFGGDPEILRRSLQLDGESYAIAGVMPGTFQYPNEVTEMWTPVTFSPESLKPEARKNQFLNMDARLAPGLTFEQASVRIEQLTREMGAAYPLERLDWRFFLSPMDRDGNGDLLRWVSILFASVACLLLIVCSNVAGLILAQSTGRQFEFSVRMALGASRFRIARTVVLEVLLLAIVGGAAALLLARTAVVLLAKYGPVHSVEIQGPVFWFGIAVTLATGLICGLYPAWAATRSNALDSFKQGGHQRTVGTSGASWQRGLIVAQVAVATTLLICGGLLIHSLMRMLAVPLGFDSRNVLTVEITLPMQRYAQAESRVNFFESVLERTRRMPGVEAASACTLLPFGYGETINTFEISGKPKPKVLPYTNFSSVLPDYFAAMRIPLLRGRTFSDRDRQGSEPVAIINEVLASRYLSAEDPIGQRIEMPWGKFTIAGVAGSVKVAAVDEDIRPMVYFPAAQNSPADMALVIRSRLPESALVDGLQSIVSQVDKDEPIYNVRQLQVYVDKSLMPRRFVASLLAGFAGAGTVLAAFGLYGVLSYMVALRRREVGIRMALGADRGAIALLIGGRGARLVTMGVILGSVAAAGTYRYLANQLYGTNLRDGATWFVVLAIVCVTGLAACAIPVWRAARLDPAECLRAE